MAVVPPAAQRAAASSAAPAGRIEYLMTAQSTSTAPARTATATTHRSNFQPARSAARLMRAPTSIPPSSQSIRSGGVAAATGSDTECQWADPKGESDPPRGPGPHDGLAGLHATEQLGRSLGAGGQHTERNVTAG